MTAITAAAITAAATVVTRTAVVVASAVVVVARVTKGEYGAAESRHEEELLDLGDGRRNGERRGRGRGRRMGFAFGSREYGVESGERERETG